MLDENDRKELRGEVLKWLVGGVLAGAAAAILAGWSYLRSVDPAALLGAAPSKNVVIMSLVKCTELGKGWERYKEANGRFVVAENPDDKVIDLGKASEHVLKKKGIESVGGSEEVVLIEAQMPTHKHGYKDIFFSETSSNHNWNRTRGHSDFTGVPHKIGLKLKEGVDQDNVGYQFSRDSFEKGSNKPHPNMPPYIALYFCKKN